MRQSVAQVTVGCNKWNVVFNNGLLELQPVVMLWFCNITAGCYLNHWLLHTIFCLLSACWIKTNGMTCIPIMFFPQTVQDERWNVWRAAGRWISPFERQQRIMIYSSSDTEQWTQESENWKWQRGFSPFAILFLFSFLLLFPTFSASAQITSVHPAHGC